MKRMMTALAMGLLACSSTETKNDSGADVIAVMDTGTTDSATTDAGSATLSNVVTLNATAYELAEGLTIHKGKAYVGLAPTGQILAIDPQGNKTTYANVPAGGNNGYTLGLAFDAQDNLFVLETKNVPDAGAPVPGIYKVPSGGGMSMTPFATDPNFVFPNGAAFDAKGNLLVTDSATGRIFSVTPQGNVTTWKQDPELAGSNACNAPLPFPIGANGIVATASDVYVSNTANGSIVKIAVDGQGNAGNVSVIVKDCKWVGFDGIARDKDGSLFAAVNGYPGKIVRVAMNGTVTVLASTDPLDGPASVDVTDTWNGKRMLLVTNSAFFSVGTDGGSPKPGLLTYGPLN